MIFDLPDNITPIGLAVLGWPDQDLPAKARFSPERIHHNVWGEILDVGARSGCICDCNLL